MTDNDGQDLCSPGDFTGACQPDYNESAPRASYNESAPRASYNESAPRAEDKTKSVDGQTFVLVGPKPWDDAPDWVKPENLFGFYLGNARRCLDLAHAGEAPLACLKKAHYYLGKAIDVAETPEINV